MSNTGSISDGYHTFDELYEHRHMLFLNLAKKSTEKFVISHKHNDGSSFEGWFIAVLFLESGEIRYHLPDRLWDAALIAGAVEQEFGPEWDGSTASDTVERLHSELKV